MEPLFPQAHTGVPDIAITFGRRLGILKWTNTRGQYGTYVIDTHPNIGTYCESQHNSLFPRGTF